MTDLVHGVPLRALFQLLKTSGLPMTLDTASITISRGEFETLVEARPPRSEEVRPGLLSIATITTRMSDTVHAKAGEHRHVLNVLALLGAVSRNGDGIYTKLPVYKDDNAWDLHKPLIAAAAIGNLDALSGALGLTEWDDDGNPDSAWTGEDFDLVCSHLSRLAVCTADPTGLTAEFPLASGQVSAAQGDRNTALLQLETRNTHPGMGPGLLINLQLPDVFETERDLHDRVDRLNALELKPGSGLPHYGAWCPGPSGRTVAYISFLPNFLHSKKGIALNFAIWAFHRCRWAAQLTDADLAWPAYINPRRSASAEPAAPPAPPPKPTVPAEVVQVVQRSIGHHLGLSSERLTKLILDLEATWTNTKGSRDTRMVSTTLTLQSRNSDFSNRGMELLLELIKLNRIA